MKPIHYLMCSEKAGELKRIVKGIKSAIEDAVKYHHETNYSVLDMNEEFESLYGIALVAMQAYISATELECYIISNKTNVDNPKIENHLLESFRKEVRKTAPKVGSSPYSEVELIWALANVYKHKSETFGIISHKMLDEDIFIQTMKTESFRKGNLEILNYFNLLTKLDIDDNIPYWDVYPICKGMNLLNYDILRICDNLISWGNTQKEYYAELM